VSSIVSWSVFRKDMADMTAQNGVFFWGTTAIIALYTIIIMFVNVRMNL
jgi:hypothetical protein